MAWYTGAWAIASSCGDDFAFRSLSHQIIKPESLLQGRVIIDDSTVAFKLCSAFVPKHDNLVDHLKHVM